MIVTAVFIVQVFEIAKRCQFIILAFLHDFIYLFYFYNVPREQHLYDLTLVMSKMYKHENRWSINISLTSYFTFSSYNYESTPIFLFY